MNRFFKILREHYLFTLFILLYGAILLSKFIYQPAPFYDWDESLYVQTGKEMIERKYFLFPVWQGEIWFDKPPLVPLLYGLVIRLFFFLPAEFAAHTFTLAIALVVLTMLYALFRKVTESQYISTAAVFLTAVTPIFLQRAQVVNLDIFLLLGWVGYLLFFPRFWLSLIFLLTAVFSKSLIGFYAPALLSGYYLALIILKKKRFGQVKRNLLKIGAQTLTGISWFVAMFALYGRPFWQMHIVESHFRRVTASIESHFGQKTFYLDLAFGEFGIFFFLSLAGLATIVFLYLKKRLTEKQLLIGLYLLPWFLFLNATKTKIFWYFFAAIPQFAFLAAAPLMLFEKRKKLMVFLSLIFIASIVYINVYKREVFAKEYASYDSRYDLSVFAKKHCGILVELVPPDSRQTFSTLNELGLLITTSKWWGARPSTVYYFGGPVTFIYDKKEMMEIMGDLDSETCIVIDQEDNSLYELGRFTRIGAFDTSYLYKQK